MSLDDFREVWVVDFEFRAAPGERPTVVCMVARELHTGRPLRLWQDELMSSPCPYPTGRDVLVVAYYASAEMGCHLALGWPLPANVLDLYAEFRVETNGMVLPTGTGLLGALAYYGGDGITALEKDAMRDLVVRGGVYTDDERLAILDYCESDVVATTKLLEAMASVISERPRLAHALLRGRYTKAVAHIEHAGVPMDGDMLLKLRTHWNGMQDRLIARLDTEFRVYDGRTFKLDQFADYLRRHGIAWPVLPSGRLALDDDTFGEQCKTYPRLRPLRELRQALNLLTIDQN